MNYFYRFGLWSFYYPKSSPRIMTFGVVFSERDDLSDITKKKKKHTKKGAVAKRIVFIKSRAILKCS